MCNALSFWYFMHGNSDILALVGGGGDGTGGE